MKESSIDKLTLETILFMSQCLQNDEADRASIDELYNHDYIKKPLNQ